jgi:RimJ/RimL family protein N-acetyltransferase
VTRRPAVAEIRTERLLLRPWRPEDEAPMLAINRHPEVQRYLNRPVTEAALAVFHGSMQAHWEQHGFGLYALESREPDAAGALLGFAGVAYPTFLPELAQRPEIGWRLARSAWGRGLATEAALAVREHAFGALGLAELIAIIHPDNARSQRVAEKLGMAPERHVWHPQLRRFVDVWALSAAAATVPGCTPSRRSSRSPRRSC